ncbi:hypothetical protein ACTXT7_015085 [Hymenolepis weldensis]
MIGGYVSVAQYSFINDQQPISTIQDFTGAITPGGPAARSKRIQIGDKIVEINGHSLAKQSHSDIVEQLCTQHHRLELTLERLESSNIFRIPVLENNCRTPALPRSGSRSSERKKFQQTSFLEPVPEAIDSSWNSRSVGLFPNFII